MYLLINILDLQIKLKNGGRDLDGRFETTHKSFRELNSSI